MRTGCKEGDLVSDERGQKGILVFDDNWLTHWSWRKLKKNGDHIQIFV